MTNEEKNLLLKDLCARLPYGVKILCEGWDSDRGCDYELVQDFVGMDDSFIYTTWRGERKKHSMNHIESIRLYLRPMSSITEEEMEEFNSMWNNDWGIILANQIENAFDKDGFHNNSKVLEITACFHAVDYINAHHFDYHDLIKKGLALEAPEGMYKIK